MFSKSIQEYVCYLTGCQGGATLRFVSILHPNPSPKRHLHRWPRAWQRTKLNRGPHARVKLPITSRQVNIQANSPGNCTRAMKITVLAQICGKQLLSTTPASHTHTHSGAHVYPIYFNWFGGQRGVWAMPEAGQPLLGEPQRRRKFLASQSESGSRNLTEAPCSRSLNPLLSYTVFCIDLIGFHSIWCCCRVGLWLFNTLQ